MRKPFIRLSALLLCLLLLAAGILACDGGLRLTLKERLLYPECPSEPAAGKWYSLSPAGAVNADGSRWRARVRFGDEDKLMIYFLGGGVVLDAHSAAQGHSAAGGNAFYYDNDLNVSHRRMRSGIAGDGADNPFRDWTILLLPYTTGDFHIGTEDIHQGYNHFTALMEMVSSRIADPKQLLITGYSAGGFGAAMLADEIMQRFPATKNVTLCVDSALLLHEDWPSVVSGLWHGPEAIAARTESRNLTLDHLRFLNEKYGGGLKILFASSLRDGGLAKFQAYIDGAGYAATPEAGMRYSRALKGMVEETPFCAFYLWDEGSALTRHTILYDDDVFTPLQDGVSVADWIADAISGEVYSCGLSLLQSLQ